MRETKILLLGATGRTGKLLLKLAMNRGFVIHCLSREVNRIKKHDRIIVFEGRTDNPHDVKRAIKGCDFVISTLNISRKSDFPWANLRTPKTFLSDTMSILVELAKKENIKRICICSAWGVSETIDQIPFWFKWIILNSNISYAYLDHERQERILQSSGLDWTIVRPVGLYNSKRLRAIKETKDNYPKPSLLISRLSVADYMLSSLFNKELIKKKIVISRQ